MILADTSVWVDHLRQGDADLARALEQGAIAIHPFVIGEIALGHLKNRRDVLDLLAALPPAPQAEQLWRDRVEVMNSLVQLRYVEAQRPVL